MKLWGFMVSLVCLVLAGCRSSEPPPPSPGVNVNAPGVHVQYSDDQGVRVQAPGVKVGVN
jgi:hypothetical protein